MQLRAALGLFDLEDLQQAREDALYEYDGITSVPIRTIQRDIELMRSDILGYSHNKTTVQNIALDRTIAV